MTFQGWEIGQHRMDVGHEKVKDYNRNWRKGNEGICRVGVQAVASEKRGMDEGTGESAHQCWLSNGHEAHKHSMSHGERTVLLQLSFPLIVSSQHSDWESMQWRKRKKVF